MEKLGFIYECSLYEQVIFGIPRRWRKVELALGPEPEARRYRKMKIAGCLAAKYLGLFFVARRLTREKLRIICYHNLTDDEQWRFRPGLFVTQSLFRQRLEYLVRKKYRVVSLSEAVTGLKKGNLPPSATVITFDDGFYNTWALAIPELKQKNLPATIYLTSYYADIMPTKAVPSSG